MSRKRPYLVFLFFLIASLVVGACGAAEPTAVEEPEVSEPEAEEAPAAEEPEVAESEEPEAYTIGLSWNRRDEALIIAWEDYLKLLGEDYNLEFVITVADGDPMRQNAQIEDLISQGVDVIMARAEDGAAIGSAITASQEAGIPFMTFDRESQSVTPDAHVGASSYELAHDMALAFAELLQDQGVEGRCIELEGDLRDQNAVYFHEGWTDAQEETGAYETLATMPTEWNPEKFRSGVVNGFQAHPDANCMFVASDFAFDAVRSALEEVGRYIPVGEEGHVWIATVGTMPPALEPMAGGYIDISAMWDAWYHAEKAVEILHRLATGEDLAGERFLVSGRIATPDNVDELEHVWARDYEQ
jgi:ABC-type sugar transport system substrate-binding protein